MSQAGKPPSHFARQVCPLCTLDEMITIEPIGPGVWELTCDNTGSAHGTPYRWQSTVSSTVDVASGEGIAAELGLDADLLRCVQAGEPFVEYGIIEHRYAELNPAAFQTLVNKYGHRRLGPTSGYSASVFIAGALRRLASYGELAFTFDDATGFWEYNGIISYWSMNPPATDTKLRWADFAKHNSLDPGTPPA